MKTNQPIESRKGHINKYGPVDCNYDTLMVQLGLRYPIVDRHPEIHTKSTQEKAELKRMIASAATISKSSPNIKQPHENVEGKLTVYLKNTQKSNTFRTTRPYTCYKSEIAGILEELADNKLTVKNYHFKY